ncbi:MAG: hypothetical protein WAS28_05975 [Saprospiraceae bacterium]
MNVRSETWYKYDDYFVKLDDYFVIILKKTRSTPVISAAVD